MQIIPAIDLIDGKCVRLTQGDYAQKKIYNENPAEVAKQFEAAGIKRLHLVDLDGAKAGTVINFAVLEKIAKETKLQVDFGGGIKSDADLDKIFNAGASMAAIGSIAVKDPGKFFEWVDKYSANKIFLGADVRNEKITVGGWLETTDLSVIDFLGFNVLKGVKNIFCTDVAKDGLLQGPSTELYKKIKKNFPSIHLVASGGVSAVADLYELKNAGLSGVIVGKAFYEGKISLKELAEFS
jgi:phosphoribosylformimino-5-aminoimidazole carboxamide ribotide isomerase